MQHVPFGRSHVNPRYANNFLDTCAFDPKYSPEHEAAQQIRDLRNDGKVHLLIAHSNQKEVDHPNTPRDVKQEAADMNYTIERPLTAEERARRAKIHAILTGNGNAEKYEADAAHVFEAGKYMGYFITTDERILGKSQELKGVTPAVILKPTDWLSIYHAAAGA